MRLRLARLIAEHPFVWLATWLFVAGGLLITGPSEAELTRHEPASLLPPDQPYSRSVAFAGQAFPKLAGQTRTVLVFAAPAGLTAAHETYLQQLTAELQAQAASHGWTILSPYRDVFLAPRLKSADGRGVLLVVTSNVNYLTLRSIHDVDAIEALIRPQLPAGLQFEITGEGGMGRDLAHAAEVAFHRTTIVTLLALLGILALIYRAPLAVLVPLVAIGVSVFTAILLLNHLTQIGWGLSTFEKTMVVVLLFGSGTDFALFWLAAFRTRLAEDKPRPVAAREALLQTGPAIVASAVTTIAGLLMLMAAELIPSFNAGRALGVALTVSLVAALTLVPALALLLGKTIFWPRLAEDRAGSAEGWWQRVATAVTHRPRSAVLLAVAVMAWPAWLGATAEYTYDALGVLPPESSSARGRELAERHFAAEQLFSWDCMVEADALRVDSAAVVGWAEEGVGVLQGEAADGEVWSLIEPLGDPETSALARLAAQPAARLLAAEMYHDSAHGALRWEILIGDPPLSSRAMAATRATLARMQAWATQRFGPSARLHATGLTPYILDIKAVTDRDQRLVMLLVVLVILVIVAALVRNIPLALVMVAGTVLVYLVTLGLTEAWFVHVAGAVGIDWKVKLFTFVILVAVGQDYNIFLVTRLLQERANHPPREAARRAIAETGGVISSCGAIMAATLGSLAATGLPFFQELGMAFALGVLLDTFLVRPIVVPAAYLVLTRGRAGEAAVAASAVA